MQRKSFLKLSSLGLAAIQFPGNAQKKIKPIVVSTWDAGMRVNVAAWRQLSNNGSALDAIENGAKNIETEQNCCVGLGGYPDRDGIVTLDACIMDHKGNCGAVAALQRIKHPIAVARKIMENTPHILLAGAGAQQFALENGFELASAELSADAKKVFEEWKLKNNYSPIINIENQKRKGPFAPAFFEDGSPNHDTMGILALDNFGNLAGGVTTSGMAFKMHGRVGDSSIVGGGLFVDNEYGAATSSGVGEEVMRICGTHLVVEFMRQGLSPEAACKRACQRIVQRDRKKAATLQVGFLALNNSGQHGAYSIQKGFVYSVKTNIDNKIIPAKYLL